MRAILMAAGKGTRISRYINGKPKCTLEIAKGMPLIKDTIKKLKKNHITDIALVVGYKQEVIKKILEDEHIHFYSNPFYDVTNSIASLWFAREFIADNDDMLFLNGDVFFEEALLNEIILEETSPVLFADETRIEQADYKFCYKNNILLKYGKELSSEETTGEYIGIAKIGRQFIPTFKTRLEEHINKQQHGLWWEDVLYSLSKETNIYVRNINRLFWAEVDYIEDYQRIIQFNQNRAETISLGKQNFEVG